MSGHAATLIGWAFALLALGSVGVQLRSRAKLREAVLRASHELRGPITAARLAAAMAMRSGDGAADRLRAIDLELEHATLALDDLGFALTNTDTVQERGVVDLQSVLVDAVQAWRGVADEQHVELELASGMHGVLVRAARLRLGQAVGNLIANAIEHGGGVVRIRAWRTGTVARVEVRDRGPGLPAPVAELTRNAHRRRGTRGRGLAIAAAIAESHGGRLAAAPSERGAKLVLQLPTACDGRTDALDEEGSAGT